MPQKLVLWDIDGTLLHTGRVAGESMRTAMAAVFGPLQARERTFYSGKTDWQIIRETFPDLSPTAVQTQLQDFLTAYTAEFQRRQQEVCERGATMPGVSALLAQLQDQAHQAPLTGNVAPIARMKLEWLGLLPYINIAAGAYGDDHEERIRLVSIAAERASRCYERDFAGQDIVVVGDTPNDIRCGKHNGSRTVAVATGPYSVDDLAAHAPDAVLPDLRDREAAVAAILG